jgi:enoyl-CoA hydratase
MPPPDTRFQTLIYEPGALARVRLNRPSKRNAQSWTLLREMDAAFSAAMADPACRVVILSGEGESFSAGHDLTSSEQQADVAREAADLQPFDRGQLSRDIYTDSHLRWRDLPKPTMAMVHGHCLYGGWMIAAAMDIIFAAEDALFLPTYGDYFTTAWDVGPRKAKELLFANSVIDAREAERRGFVNRVVPSARLEAETLAFADRVAGQDTARNRLIKFAINQAQDAAGFSHSVRAVGAAFITRDYPVPGEASSARPAGLDLNGRFRSAVSSALAHHTARAKDMPA